MDKCPCPPQILYTHNIVDGRPLRVYHISIDGWTRYDTPHPKLGPRYHVMQKETYARGNLFVTMTLVDHSVELLSDAEYEKKYAHAPFIVSRGAYIDPETDKLVPWKL